MEVKTMRKPITLDINRVLEIYDAACKTCPECGRKMLPLDWSDYCRPCGLSIPRDYHSSSPKVNQE